MTKHRKDTTARGVVLVALLLGLAACGGGGSCSGDGPFGMDKETSGSLDGITSGGDGIFADRSPAVAEPTRAPARIHLRTEGSTARRIGPRPRIPRTHRPLGRSKNQKQKGRSDSLPSSPLGQRGMEMDRPPGCATHPLPTHS